MAAPLLTLASACSKGPEPGAQAGDLSEGQTYWVGAPLVVWRGAGEPGSVERKFSGHCRVTPMMDGKPGVWLNAAPGSTGIPAWWESGPGQPISVHTGELRYLGDCLEEAGLPTHRESPPVGDACFWAGAAANPAAFSLRVELEATESLGTGASAPYRSAQAEFSSDRFPLFDDARNPGRMNTVEVECSSPSGDGSLVLTLRLWQTTGR
jgi:hypothetical protein